MSRTMKILLVLFILAAGSCIYSVASTPKAEYKLVPVAVVRGHTLWDIAGQYRTEEEDVRAVIWRIRCVNEDKIGPNCEIIPGTVLNVPVRETRRD